MWYKRGHGTRMEPIQHIADICETKLKKLSIFSPQLLLVWCAISNWILTFPIIIRQTTDVHKEYSYSMLPPTPRLRLILFFLQIKRFPFFHKSHTHTLVEAELSVDPPNPVNEMKFHLLWLLPLTQFHYYQFASQGRECKLGLKCWCRKSLFRKCWWQ